MGVRDSQFNLAILYARGLGIEQSMVESYKWFSIAAAQGDEDAAKKRDPSFSCAKMFWWYNMYSTADWSVTPRPIYLADGLKLAFKEDVLPAARDRVDGSSPFVIVLQRERAAVANQDRPRKAALDRRVGDDLERTSRGIGAFVDVEIEFPALALCEFEEDSEPIAQTRLHADDGAENPRPVGVKHRFDVGHV